MSDSENKKHFAQAIDPDSITKFHKIGEKVGIKPALLLERIIDHFDLIPYDKLIHILFFEKNGK